MLKPSLRSQITEIMSQAEGVFGLVVRLIDTGEEIEINCDEVFPSASIIKLPILVEALRQRAEGRLSLEERVTLREEDKVGGSGVLKEMTPGLSLPFSDVLTLMIIVSDNMAANIAIARVGMENVNAYMRQLGLQKTTLQRKLMDFETRKRGLDNLTSPRDMADLLQKLATKTMLNEENCEKALDIMKRQQVRDRIPRYLPSSMPMANKTGEIAGIRHDIGVVFAKDHPYIISAMSKDLKDERMGIEAIARISEAVYKDVTAA
jgi:beta-lactamase class A